MARTFLTECRAPQEAVDKAEDLRLPQLQGAIQDARPPVDTRLPGIPGREGSGESPKLDAWGDKKKRINVLLERITSGHRPYDPSASDYRFMWAIRRRKDLSPQAPQPAR